MLKNQIYQLLNEHHWKQTDVLHTEERRLTGISDQVHSRADVRHNKAKIALLRRQIEELEASGEFPKAKTKTNEIAKLQQELEGILVAAPTMDLANIAKEKKAKARELLQDVLREVQRFSDEAGCEIQIIALERVVVK